MSQQETSPEPERRPVHDDEIDLVELFRALWRGKWWIISVTLLAAVLAVFYALALPEKYQASALVAPATDGGDGGLSAMARQYGGLASIAGIDLGRGDTGKRQIALETLKSRQFLTDFIRRHDLKVALLATKAWDHERGEWVIDGERYDVETGEWLATERDQDDPEPSDWRAFKAFQEKLSISEDRDTGMVTVSIESQSPLAAKNWVEWLVQDINAHLKERDMEETRRNVAYLEDQLEHTSISGMRQVFFSLIEEQTKTLMLAELDKEYAFQVIDPPIVPEERSAPNRSLIVVLAVMLGGMLATFGVLVGYAFRER